MAVPKVWAKMAMKYACTQTWSNLNLCFQRCPYNFEPERAWEYSGGLILSALIRSHPKSVPGKYHIASSLLWLNELAGKIFFPFEGTLFYKITYECILLSLMFFSRFWILIYRWQACAPGWNAYVNHTDRMPIIPLCAAEQTGKQNAALPIVGSVRYLLGNWNGAFHEHRIMSKEKPRAFYYE